MGELDKTARIIIGSSVTGEALKAIRVCKSAADMWSKLLVVFEKKSYLSKDIALKKYYTFTKLEGESITAFFTRLEGI